jgi:glycerol-3-phosphate dehydrogenase subunit C
MDPKRRVALFTGCFFNYYDPTVSDAAVAVLEHNGFQVVVPDQSCCGLPMEAKGNHAGAVRNIAHNARAFRQAIAQGCPVVTLCPSCYLFIRRHYGLEGGEDGGTLARSITLISSFLLQLNASGQLSREFKALPQTVFYQTPCHLTAAGIGQPSVDLLKLIPGVDIRHISTECCGLSGTWGYEKKNATLSLDIGRKLFEDIRQVKADLVITDCGSCRMQAEAGAAVSPLHPIVMLKRAYS